jgi:hypothetical protein
MIDYFIGAVAIALVILPIWKGLCKKGRGCCGTCSACTACRKDAGESPSGAPDEGV